MAANWHPVHQYEICAPTAISCLELSPTGSSRSARTFQVVPQPEECVEFAGCRRSATRRSASLATPKRSQPSAKGRNNGK